MSPKRVLIVGGVAGGASCAARLRRLDEQAEIVVFEKGPYPSFANCGLRSSFKGQRPSTLSNREGNLVKDRDHQGA